MGRKEELNLSDDLTLEDIDKIRAYNNEKTKGMTWQGNK